MTEQRFDSNLALDPARSVVVEACAGSGKTWLLVSRILRALLSGAEPSEILAITFTRKAALEMQARLNEWLEMLATKDGSVVRQELAIRGIPESEMETLLPLARDLHEKVLMTRPGITITTFHGWFLEVLKRAPIDSGVGQFELTEQAGMLEKEAWLRLKDRLRREPKGPVAQAFDRLVSEIGLKSTRDLLSNFLRHRTDWFATMAGEQDAITALQDRLSKEADVSPTTDVLGECLNGAFVQELSDYASLLLKNNEKPEAKYALLASELLEALTQEDNKTIFDAAFKAVISPSSGAAFIHKSTGSSKKRLGTDEPRFFALHQQISKTLLKANEQLLTQSWLALHKAGLICGTALLDEFQALKDQRQLLDFGDIEWLTAQLLTDSDSAEYLQYKLDARYRHILLDEFQDTNPLQWKILRAWLSASQDAGRSPSVFMVGDPKQSIYRFRGADARLFDEAAAFLKGQGAIKLMHNTTRRLAPPVLEIVNRSFAAVADRYSRFQPHEAHEETLPGYVELFPMFAAPKIADGSTELRDPLTAPLHDVSGAAREAEAVHFASRLLEIKANWCVKEKHGVRSMRWSDVLALVRTRKHLATYEQALKAAGIPVISSRQGGLLDTLEARDLIALLTFLVTPSANLELAHTLRSPLFGCTDEDLLTLAGNENWWAVLKTSTYPRFVRAAELLGRWRKLAGHLPVHDLLDRVFHEGDMLSRYLAAVPETMKAGVAANLHALMELALNLSGGRYPSLPRFVFELKQLRSARAEEAPDEADTSDGQDAVTLLTVHGAKGLESPVVWLLDAGPTKSGADSYRVLSDWKPGEDAPRHFSLFFKKDLSGTTQRDLLEKEAGLMQTEAYNLLYVAMTRAKQALFISGNDSRAKGLPPERDWHARIREGFGNDDAETVLVHGSSLELPHELKPAPFAGQEVVASKSLVLPPVMPVGMRRKNANSVEIRLGTLVHLLLEEMSKEAPVDLNRLRAQQTDDFVRARPIAESIYRASALQRFFDSAKYRRARNELSFVDRAGQIQRIDRLVEFENETWVLDYKTGEADKASDETDLIKRYRVQLETYVRAVESLVPDKPVRAGIILADGRLVEL